MAPRVLKGGLLSVISTVWAETGLLWDKVSAEHGKPRSCLAAIAKTLVMRSDDRIRQIVDEESDRDPENAQREFECEPFPQGTGLFFDTDSIRSSVDSSLPAVILPSDPDLARAGEPTVIVGVGIDTGLVSDSSACVIVHRVNDIYTIAEIVELRPSKGNPLQLSEVCRTYAETMQRHYARSALADHHELEASREHLRALNVGLDAAPGGADGKFQVYSRARELLSAGKVRISAKHSTLIRQLKDVHKKPRSGGGLQIWSPRRGGRHGDVASAAILGIFAASERSTHHYIPRLPPRMLSRWDNMTGRGY